MRRIDIRPDTERAKGMPDYRPEARATLRYGDVEFEISYTLLHWMVGWLVMGMKGTAVQDLVAMSRLRGALEYIEAAMGFDSMRARMTDEEARAQAEFYGGHGIRVARPTPEDFVYGLRERVEPQPAYDAWYGEPVPHYNAVMERWQLYQTLSRAVLPLPPGPPGTKPELQDEVWYWVPVEPQPDELNPETDG